MLLICQCSSLYKVYSTQSIARLTDQAPAGTHLFINLSNDTKCLAQGYNMKPQLKFRPTRPITSLSYPSLQPDTQVSSSTVLQNVESTLKYQKMVHQVRLMVEFRPTRHKS